MKRYSIYVDGFDPVQFEAETASKARYRAFLAWRDAGYGRQYPCTATFKDFLSRVTQTLHFGEVK